MAQPDFFKPPVFSEQLVPAELTLLPAALPDGISGVFTTRVGGVSTGPFASLNVALQGLDERPAVLVNRARVARSVGVAEVFWAEQVHGALVSIVDEAPGSSRAAPGADALVTTVPGVALGVLVADCVPVLLADPVAGVIATAHAGRRGLVAGVVENTVAAMVRLGADPADIVAAVGPCIGGCCYEVPLTLRDEVSAVVRDVAATTRWGTPSLDLAGGVATVLRRAGVCQLVRVGGCTYEDPRFYSYRREPVTGRFAGVLVRRR